MSENVSCRRPQAHQRFQRGDAHRNAGEDYGENVGKDAGKSADAGTLAAPTTCEDSREFRWNDEATVVRSQPAIAVYLNSHDEIMIRQESLYGNEDHWIYINRQDLPLLRRLQEIEHEQA